MNIHSNLSIVDPWYLSLSLEFDLNKPAIICLQRDSGIRYKNLVVLINFIFDSRILFIHDVSATLFVQLLFFIINIHFSIS